MTDAEFNAIHKAQYENLNLRPWELCPCEVDADSTDELYQRDNYRAAQQLLRRMLAAGVDKYDPEPLRGLEKAEGKRRR